VEATGAGSTGGAAPTLRARIRTRVAVVLLLLGLAVAVMPGLAAGDAFRPSAWICVGSWRLPFPPTAAPSSGAAPTKYSIEGEEVTIELIGGATNIRAKGSIRIVGTPFGRSSLIDLVLHEAGWTAAAVALLALAPLFVWWRRAALTFGRVAGIASSVAAAASVCLLVLVPRANPPEFVGGVWWTVPLGAVLMGAAFVVAPAPVPRRDD